MSVHEEVKVGHPDGSSTVVCGVGIQSPKKSGNVDFSFGGQPGRSQIAMQVLGSGQVSKNIQGAEYPHQESDGRGAQGGAQRPFVQSVYKVKAQFFSRTGFLRSLNHESESPSTGLQEQGWMSPKFKVKRLVPWQEEVYSICQSTVTQEPMEIAFFQGQMS